MINEANTRKSYDKFPGVLSSAELTKKKAVVKTTKGTIEFEILGQEAPKAASNFIFLSKEGFYDGLTFHRREENFVIQGGDPEGTGMGGPGYKFEDEPVKLDYKRGIVAMANSGPDTNGSQFFIMLADTNLPKKYTIFSRVISGLDVVDKIQVGDKMEKITVENL
jgi:cyclophilin family peptidyl-prolyl cis-trans isomerase